MNSFRTLSSVCLLIVGMLMSQAHPPQTRQVSGVVETLDGKRLPHVMIRITNIGGTTTSDSGEFVFELTQNVAPGQSIQLSLGGDWVISSPWEGRTFAPMLGTDSIQVRVAQKGDPRLLADSEFVKNIVVGVTSELRSSSPEGGDFRVVADPNEYLSSKAKEFGLTVEEIKSAIDKWLTEAQGPYQEALVALYAKRFGEASQLIRRSIASSEQDLFSKYLVLSNAEFSQNHYADTEAALRKALAIHPDYPAALDLLGWVLAMEDRFDEARSTLEFTLQIYQQAFGKENSATAPVLCNLGSVDTMSGHFPEAVSAAENALAIIDKDHQGTNRTVGDCLTVLAEALRVQGKFPQAESDAQRALSIANQQGGPSSLEATYPLVTLGLICKNTGRYSQAVELLERVRMIEEKELDPLDPTLVRDLTNLASAYEEEHDLVSAQRVLERALAVNEGAHRGDSLDLAGVLCNLGTVYAEEGRYAEAKPLLEHALVISQRELGPENYRVATVLRQLGILALAEKNFPEAENFLRKALSMDESVHGPDHLATGIDHEWLGTLNSWQGSDAAAEAEYRLAYAALLKQFGSSHPEVRKAASNIAITLRKEGKNVEAREFDSLAAIPGRESVDPLP